MYYRIFSKLYEKAAEKMCRDCQKFINKNSRILDLGCGSGIIGEKFQKFFQAELIGVDIKDNRTVPLPFELINGLKLPFPEDYFDAVLINYVLHHSLYPISLLKEAKRVTKDKIILYEDLPEGRLSEWRCKIHRSSFNLFFQKNLAKGNFFKFKEWEKIFKDLDLKLIFEKITFSGLDPVRKELFILKKI